MFEHSPGKTSFWAFVRSELPMTEAPTRARWRSSHCCFASSEPTGPDTLVFSQINGKRVLCRVHPATNPRPGEEITLAFDLTKAVLFDPNTGGRVDARP